MTRASGAPSDLTTLPNLLTLGRVAIVPLLVAAFYLPAPATYWVCLALFALAAITDFFDGWLARARDQISDFGRFLDPIADKILVAAALVMLVASNRLAGLAVIAGLVILCREFVISGLREFLAGADVTVHVSPLAKWKTAVQMVAIGFLLVGAGAPAAVPATEIGEVLLWIAAALTVVTGVAYFKAGLAHVTGRRPGA
jgi:cardiolipin synthase